MSFGASHDAKEQVRQAVDIVELIKSYIELRPTGRDFVGRCPWHDDSKPSLHVNRERQYWKCWVCDIGGDAFSFVMRKEGVDFREALQMLADRAGIQLQRVQAPAGSAGDKRTLYQANSWAEEQYHRCLLQDAEAEPARRYLAERGIQSESIRRYGLGFSPSGWQWLHDRAKSSTFTPKVLETVGLIKRSDRSGQFYDPFRGRLMFPIRDSQRRTIAFGARVVPGVEVQNPDAKYINSNETPLYVKSEQLYGLDVVRDAVAKSRRITVMEGYTDVIMSVQYGLENVVAICGTSLTARHLQLLKRYADVVTLVLDGDEAGQRRTNQILEMFIAEQLDLRILTLPEELDPAEYLEANGADALRELCDNAVDALEHKMRLLTQDLDVNKDTHRANQALEEILRIIALAPSAATSVESASRLRQQQVLARLARQFQVSDDELRRRLAELRKTRTRPSQSTTLTTEPQKSFSVPELSSDRELLEILTLQPDLLEVAQTSIPLDRLTYEPSPLIYQHYLDLWHDTGEVGFQHVMLLIEDPELKSLLVSIDAAAHEKSARAEQSPAERLEGLIAHFVQNQNEFDRRRCLSDLDQGKDEEKEVSTLLEIIELKRQRQV